MAKFCIDISKYDPRFHTIVSGPYQTLGACYTPCGATDPNSTTTTTTSTTTSTTTRGPNFLSPPLTNGGGMIFNPNDKTCILDIQVLDSSSNWIAFSTVNISSDSAYNVNIFPYIFSRTRVSADGFVSDWSSDNYNYINTDNIVAAANGSVITNPNNFSVYAVSQERVVGSSDWIPSASVAIGPNSSYYGLSNNERRVRFAKTGPGISVSSWST